jgi:hypothetical protein
MQAPVRSPPPQSHRPLQHIQTLPSAFSRAGSNLSLHYIASRAFVYPIALGASRQSDRRHAHFVRMPSSLPASLQAPRRKSFSAAIVLALITLQLLPYISGSTCSADAAPSDACPSDGINPARPTKYSSITCSTSESAFPAGEQGTMNWAGWRCAAYSAVD